MSIKDKKPDTRITLVRWLGFFLMQALNVPHVASAIMGGPVMPTASLLFITGGLFCYLIDAIYHRYWLHIITSAIGVFCNGLILAIVLMR